MRCYYGGGGDIKMGDLVLKIITDPNNEIKRQVMLFSTDTIAFRFFTHKKMFKKNV